jgi:hypothetical protein
MTVILRISDIREGYLFLDKNKQNTNENVDIKVSAHKALLE